MGKKVISLIWVGVLLIGLISCGGKGGDSEPNNTIEQAVKITLAQPFSMKVTPVGDWDWFKVDLPEQGYLKVQASNIPEEIGLEVAFALYQEWEGEKTKYIRDWHRVPDAVFIPEAGTYYFVIKDDYDDRESNNSIEIKVDFLKEFDPNEPNNKAEEAKLVEFNSVVKPAIYPTGDQDWFKIKVEKQGYLLLKSKNVPEHIVPEIKYTIYDEWLDPKIKVIRDWHRIPDACSVINTGVYYILLHDDYDDRSSETSFELKIDFLEEMDKYEPNNNFKDAKSVNRGDTLKLAIFPTSDHDYFMIKLEVENKIKFMAKDFASEIVPEIKFYILNPEDPNELKEVTEWKRCPAEFELEVGKEYYFLVHDDYDDRSSPKPFELKIE